MKEEEDFLILLEELMDELDEEYNARQYIYQICGGEEFHPYKNILSQRVLERYLDEIIIRIEEMRVEYYENDPYGEIAEKDILGWYYILAILIFETGSAFPEKVKEVILNKKLNWAEHMGMEVFRQKVRKHVSGSPLKSKMSELREKRIKEAYQKYD